MVNIISNFIIKNSKIVILIIFILGSFLGLYSLLNLKVDAELTQLAPADEADFNDQLKFTAEKVISNTLLVVAKVSNVNDIDKFVFELKEMFENTPYVSMAEPFDNPETLIKYGLFAVDKKNLNNVINYYKSLFFIEPRSIIDFRFWRNVGTALYNVTSFANAFLSRSGIKKYYLISSDKDILLMNFSMAKPVTDVNFVNKAIPYLKNLSKKISEKWNSQILFSGSAMSNYEGNIQVTKDFQITTLISLFGISLLLLLSYGSTSTMLFLFVSMLLSMGISMGIIVLLFKKINIITSFVNAMLLGLGIDYGIHITAKIHENIRLHGKTKQSITEAIKENLVPSSVSAITTSVALGVIALSPSQPLKQMGISSAVGVIIFYLIMNLLIPSFYITFLHRIRVPKKEYFSRFIELVRKFKPITIAIWVILIGFSYFGYEAMKNFSYTPPGLIPGKSESIIAGEIALKKFGEFGIGNVIIGAKTFEELKKIKEDLDKSPLFSGTFSILNFVENPQMLAEVKETFYKQLFDIINEPMLDIVFRKYKLYDSLIETLTLLRNAKTFEDIFVSLEKDIPTLFFYDTKGNRYFLIYAKETVPLWENNGLQLIYGDVLKNYKVFGYPALFYKVMKYLINSTIKAAYFVIVAILIVLMIDQLNLIKGIKITFYVFLTIASAIGLGYFVFNIELTFLNLLIIPIFMGIGVDSMIHLSHSIKYGRESIVKTEKAVTVSNLTTIIAFGSFLFAKGELLREFGILVVIGLIISWFVSIFLYLNSEDKIKISK
ncbi:MMPL family transporter [Thermosipho ferrireducens]|uniref:MMPL family transporter n=1 Tax=Thermosipho ferrireducens TaxID=2571116 RepID=A0ABX7S8B8_9BACT|nr:MMPL family transporter [Thermosipho ferrireducens]QTA38847.1 MMPL family transporter [Thermosipho ferrireducens]